MIFMKKYRLWLPVVWLVFGAAIYTTSKGSAANEKQDTTVTKKNISFAVYKGDNYISDVYNNTSAKLHITIEKVKGTSRTILWDKTFDAMQLKQYPSLEHALTQQVSVPNVLSSKEHIEITYTLTYNSNGSELQMQNGTIIPNNANSEKLDISI